MSRFFIKRCLRKTTATLLTIVAILMLYALITPTEYQLDSKDQLILSKFIQPNAPLIVDEVSSTKKVLKIPKSFARKKSKEMPTLPLRNNLYAETNANFKSLLNQLILNQRTHTYQLRNGSALIWSYFDALHQMRGLPAYVKMSAASVTLNERRRFSQILANRQTAKNLLPDLHPAFAQLPPKFRERYFAGRILEKFGGFYLSATSIYFKPFLGFVENLEKEEFCLVIQPWSPSSLVGPIRAGAPVATQWKDAVHERLDKLVAEQKTARDAKRKQTYLPEDSQFPSLQEFIGERYPHKDLTCEGAKRGRYAFYTSPRDLKRMFPDDMDAEEILATDTDFALEFQACCLWQSKITDRQQVEALRVLLDV